MTGAGADPADPGPARQRTTVEVRPSRAVALVMGAVALVSAAAAVAGLLVGEVLLGCVALVSALWLGSLARTSWRASSVADADGIEVVWVRTRRRLRWDDVDSVVIDGVAAGGTLGSTTLVARSGAHLRWAPWYPFLWFTHPTVRRSVERLTDLCRERGIEVTDVAAAPRPDPTAG